MAQTKIIKPSKGMQLVALLKMSLFFMLIQSNLSQATETIDIKSIHQFNSLNNIQKASMQKPDYNPAEQPAKHCVSTISVKTQKIYLFENWYDQAKTQSKKSWQETVRKRFGSVYSNWPVSINKIDNCTRIGLANTDTGKIGVHVLCSISAVPCTRLTN